MNNISESKSYLRRHSVKAVGFLTVKKLHNLHSQGKGIEGQKLEEQVYSFL